MFKEQEVQLIAPPVSFGDNYCSSGGRAAGFRAEQPSYTSLGDEGFSAPKTPNSLADCAAADFVQGSQLCDSRTLSCNNPATSTASPLSSSGSSSHGGGGKGGVTKCFGCGLTIYARFYVQAMQQPFHNQCLKCTVCRVVLSEEPTCFERDGRILCKQDYYRLYANSSTRLPRRCARCTTGINFNDLVMRANDLVYHVQCFACTICQRVLHRGEQFRMQSTDLYCRLHYDMVENGGCSEEFGGSESIVEHPRQTNVVGPPKTSGKRGRPPKRKLLTGIHDNLKDPIDPPIDYFHLSKPPGIPVTSDFSPAGVGGGMDGPPPPSSMNGCYGGSAHSPGDSYPGGNLPPDPHHHPHHPHHPLPGQPQKGKRMRTTFKHNQLRIMKSYFEMNPNPDTKDLKQLSQKTGLCKRVLQVWFQNARAKHRRTCSRSDSSLSGNGILQLDDSQEWSPPQTFSSQSPPSEHSSKAVITTM